MKLLVYILFLFSYLTIQSQPPTKFYGKIGGAGYDNGYDVKQTLDNGYIISGSTSSFGQGNTDLYLLKLDSMGQIKFQRAIGNHDNEVGRSVVQLIDSSFVTVGYTNSIGFGGYDVYLIKTDKIGNVVWQKTIGGADWDFAYSLQETTDGGFIVCGTTYSFGYGNADGYVIKTDAAGNVSWSKTYGGSNDDEFKSVIQTADGGYALTGYTKSYNDIDSGDVWVFKLDLNGDSLWSKYYGGSKEDFGRGIIQLQNSDLFVSGGTKSFSVNGNYETQVLGYNNTTGVPGYNYRDVSNQDEYYNCVAQGINGTIANCGATKNMVFGYDGLMDMYSSSYGYVNFFSIGSSGIEEFYAVNKTKDKGFIAVGKTNGYGAMLEDVYILKTDSVGNSGLSIVSVKENSINGFSSIIYPNPAVDEFHITIPEFHLYNEIYFSIIDINGQIVLKNKISQVNTKIEVQKLSTGLYFIQLYSDNQLFQTSKISIIK